MINRPNIEVSCHCSIPSRGPFFVLYCVRRKVSDKEGSENNRVPDMTQILLRDLYTQNDNSPTLVRRSFEVHSLPTYLGDTVQGGRHPGMVRVRSQADRIPLVKPGSQFRTRVELCTEPER